MEEETRNSREDESFIASRTVITTSTLYRNWYPGELRGISDTDKVRGDLALETVISAVNSGFRLVVADRESPIEFSQALETTGALVMRGEGIKRSPSRRQVFRQALSLPQSDAIFWTEPEKMDIIKSVTELARPIVTGEADLVIPARNPEMFRKFYPSYMYESEIVANRLFNRFLRKFGLLSEDIRDLDVFFGPRVFSKKALELAMKKYRIKDERIRSANEFIDPEEYSGATIFPIIAALYNNLRVTGVEIPFQYPVLQRKDEEAETAGKKEEFKVYRDKQRKGILVGAAQFLNYLQNKKSSIEEII